MLISAGHFSGGEKKEQRQAVQDQPNCYSECHLLRPGTGQSEVTEKASPKVLGVNCR